MQFTEYVAKLQEDTLEAVSQVQEANITAFQAAREFMASFPANAFQAQDMPSTKKMIESSFDFSHRLLDLRKQFALEMADIFAKTQSDIAQTTK